MNRVKPENKPKINGWVRKFKESEEDLPRIKQKLKRHPEATEDELLEIQAQMDQIQKVIRRLKRES